MRETTGELRHAETWLGNQMGRSRLFAARRERPGAEPEMLPENHPASVYVDQLAGGVGGQSAILRGFGAYFMTPGIGVLCGYDPRDGGGPTWQVRDVNELRLSPMVDETSGMQQFEVQTGDLVDDWMPLGANGLVVEVHRPDPRKRWKPDSPVRGALPILNELSLLTQSIEATATSRLAGAGILPLPREMEFEGSWDSFVQDLIKAFTTPIRNRASVAATVPFPIKVEGKYVDKIKPVTFHSPFDEHALELRQELIWRLGTAMDMPVRALTGEQENHWGKAATAEEGVQIHVVPDVELVCDGITRGYLNPAMMGEARRREGADVPSTGLQLIRSERDGGLQVVDGDGFEILVWYDIGQLTTKPDRSEDAGKLYDALELDGEGWRAEVGITDGAPPDDDEFHRRMMIKVVEHGTDQGALRLSLVKLGVFTEDELAALPAESDTGPAAAPDVPGDDPPAEPGPVPATEPDDAPPSDQALPEAAHVALVAAAAPMVHRALERAGNRLRQAITRSSPGRRLPEQHDVQAPMVHTTCIAAEHQPLDVLLEGAWCTVAEVAPHLGHDPELLADTLDAYVRGLLAERKAHSWPLLDAYLAAAPSLSPAERVLAAVGGRAA